MGCERSRRQAIYARALTLDSQKVRSRIEGGLSPPLVAAAEAFADNFAGVGNQYKGVRVLLADHILQVQRLLFALRRHDDRLFGVLVKALRLVNGRAAVQHVGDVAVNLLRL